MTPAKSPRADAILLFVDNLVLLATAFVVTCLFGAALASELAMWVRW